MQSNYKLLTNLTFGQLFGKFVSHVKCQAASWPMHFEPKDLLQSLPLYKISYLLTGEVIMAIT